MNRPVTTLVMCAALVAAMPLRAQLQATLSQSTIARDQPVILTLESDGAVSAPPDLSPLEQDFQIVHRSTSRSSRNINGRQSQRTSLALTLVPKRSGTLTIPAIEFGQERSRSLQLSVTPATNTGPDAGLADTRSMEPMASMPLPFPSQGRSFNRGFTPPSLFPGLQDPGATQGWNGWNNGGFGLPGWTAEQETAGWQAQPEQTATPAETGDRGAGYWPWITGLLLTGWILTTLILTWRTGRSPKAPANAVPPAATGPKLQQQANEALEEVRRAYQHSDAFAAKTALLRWAATRWPADPPTNLSRLAAHCPLTVQRHILKLDESLYSPKPIAWNQTPVWEELRDLAPEKPEESHPAAPLTQSNP